MGSGVSIPLVAAVWFGIDVVVVAAWNVCKFAVTRRALAPRQPVEAVARLASVPPRSPLS